MFFKAYCFSSNLNFLICFTSLSQAEWCSYGDADRMCASCSGQQRPGRISSCGARGKMTSKNLKTEHVYFSDSSYSVWKRVNTITLTTELEGFEGLTGHCFPRERWGLGRVWDRGLRNQVAWFVFPFFSEMPRSSYGLFDRISYKINSVDFPWLMELMSIIK